MKVSNKGLSLFEFGLREMAECGRALREIGKQESDMEAFAEQATLYFYENLVDGAGNPACAHIRFSITPFSTASAAAPANGLSDILMQLGLEGVTVRNLSENAGTGNKQQNYELLYVADAQREPAAQKALIPDGIQSILGLGCRLPSGDLFDVILFVKIAITESTAELFRTIALNLRLATLRFDRQPIFASGEST